MNHLFKVLKLVNYMHPEVEKYIQPFSEEVKEILLNTRNCIIENAPDAEEWFSYGMPAYKFKNKPLIYFAAFKSHLGIYAIPNTHVAFKDELNNYKQGKGSVQFPFNKPIPYALIVKMIKFRLSEINTKLS